jgi:protein-S-isoprenylcysteine O-methyltransferase Ste14
LKHVTMLDHLKAILLLPFMVTVAVPALLLEVSDGWNGVWPINGLSVWGMFFIIAGLILLALTIRLFHRQGRGTLAPWNPTQKLVVAGPYRYVRNPMISGVLMILLGESMLFGSWLLFAWWLLFWGINHTYFLLYEEPGLVQRFGEDYVRYKEHVPRWIPRLTAWEPDEERAEAVEGQGMERTLDEARDEVASAKQEHGQEEDRALNPKDGKQTDEHPEKAGE